MDKGSISTQPHPQRFVWKKYEQDYDEPISDSSNHLCLMGLGWLLVERVSFMETESVKTSLKYKLSVVRDNLLQ